MKTKKFITRKDPTNRKKFNPNIRLPIILVIIFTIYWFGNSYTLKGQSFHIQMERWVCNNCDAYKVNIYGSGIIIYDGQFWGKEKGRQIRFISQQDIQKIITQLEATDFFYLKNIYSDKSNDFPMTQIKVEYDRDHKTIIHVPDGKSPDFDIAPATLEIFEDLIENLATQ